MPINLQKVESLKVLVVGDGITDEYRYVKSVGKAIKSDSLSTISRRRETFHGGAWAAAQHTCGFCTTVDVMTGSGVMRNRYYVEETYNRKLFNVHEYQEVEIMAKLAEAKDHDIPSYDLVIVTDFGHGTMTKALIERVSREARYLAVNAQTNSTNYGFNLITKYPRADYVVLDELEARLAARERDAPIEDVILALGLKKIIVTMGANGAVGFDGAFERQSATANKVLDTMGAGDAFLCVTAPFAAAGYSMKQLLQIGNAAGAIKVGIVGHRGSVDRKTLEVHLNG